METNDLRKEYLSVGEGTLSRKFDNCREECPSIVFLWNPFDGRYLLSTLRVQAFLLAISADFDDRTRSMVVENQEFDYILG